MKQLRVGQWYFAAWEGRSKWIGLAKREPFVNGHPIYEPGDVWFEFGETEADALSAIKRKMLD
jgi:hypothetical protein